VLHVGNEWEEFFYPALRPWLHFIPVESAASQADLQQLLEFLRGNDAHAREIAERGAAFLRQHLKFADIGCYWRRLLTSFAALLTYTVQPDPELFEIVPSN
jgi:protein glucosyltransferase